MGQDVGGSIGFYGHYDASSDQVPWGVIKGGKVTNTSGDYAGYLAFGTSQGGAGFAEAMRISSNQGVSIGNTTDPGAGNLSVNGSAFIGTTSGISGSKLTVNGQIATSPFTAINSSTATTIATCVSCLAVLRDRGSGGTALILYDNSSSPAVTVVSQTGAAKFVTTSPLATQIQIANGGNSLTALTGSSIGTTNLNICILQNQ
jgi:hypothetical protein